MSAILLIEDDAWLAEIEAQVLREAGYTVEVAPHGFAAMDKLDTYTPEVIILDVLLTGSTAFSFLNELRSHGDIGAIPIILCTNIAEQFKVQQLREYGVRRIVDKVTMRPDDLVAAVRSVLLDSESAGEAT